MIIQSRLAITRLSMIVLLLPLQSALAHGPRQSEPSTSRTTRTPQKEQQKGQSDNQETQTEPDLEMRQAIRQLTVEINSLSAELQRLRKVTERNSQTMELMLHEERLSKVDDKIQALSDQKSLLDVREQEIQRRMRNIPGEMLSRGLGSLRREESEAAIKAELQRALDDVRNQQAGSQNRLAELTVQAERLRARIVVLREKVEQEESKSERQER